ncbi:MAG: S41 family peptidase [candidate division Zixibacteria bacterium]|nr:S41 family peptidase [candidate division Zixibacteria bacterium]
MNPSTLANRQAILTSLILIICLILLSGGIFIFVLSDPALGQAYTLIRAAQRIDTEYFDEVSTEQLVKNARHGMFDMLDRYSSYVSADEFDRIKEELTGTYAGIGISIIKHNSGLMIMSVRKDGPSRKAGLAVGDIIISADSTELTGLSTSESTKLLRGEEGTNVLVRVLQPSEDTIETLITRKRMPLIHVPYAGYTQDSAMYIRLLDFDAGASEQLQVAFDSLLNKSSIRPCGLILDLRGNPGGLFQEAYQTANLFLKEGDFVTGTDARSRWNTQELYATGSDISNGLPMVVIVDSKSASSSEILAGALQQAGRATLVGDTTYGKGLVQGFISFPDGNGLRLTISRFYFNNDIYINEFDSTLNDIGHGLVPDYFFEFPDENEFVRAVENSLLLQQFARLHQNEIISSSDDDLISSKYIDSLELFLIRKGFTFTSLCTEQLKGMLQNTRPNDYTKASYGIIRRATRISEKEDRKQLHRFSNFLTMRLQQIAYEQKFGTYRAYNDIIVNQRLEIQFASHLLHDKRIENK